MKITTDKGQEFEAYTLNDAIWGGGLMIGLAWTGTLSELAADFEGLSAIAAEDGRVYPVGDLQSLARVSPDVSQIRLNRRD